MKREFLEELGIEKEVMDKIMAENGKDIQNLKKKIEKAESDRDEYKSQLDTANEKLEGFKDVNPEELNQKIEDLKQELKDKDTEYQKKESDRVFNESLEKTITELGGKNATAIMSLLDVESLKGSKNQDSDIKTALEKLKEDNDYLFESNEPIQNPTGRTDGDGDSGSDSDYDALRAVMGLPSED